MRIIFTGQAGVKKSLAIRNLIRYGRRRRIDIEHVCIEDRIGEIFSSMIPFLEESAKGAREESWKAALRKVLKNTTTEDRHLLIEMHCTFYRKGRWFCPIDMALIRKLNPDCIVTFTDNIYEVQQILRKANPRDNAIKSLRLRELSSWRSQEIILSDLMARTIHRRGRRVPMYVVPVKHSVEMLFRLLFKPKVLRIYTAFPITSVGRVPRLKAEINAFRSKVKANYTVFDPLTIEEEVLKIKADNSRPKQKTLQLVENEIWGIPLKGTLIEGREEQFRITYPLRLAVDEVKEVALEVHWQTEQQDFAFIDQANCVVAYRPEPKGIVSSGVRAELQYARGKKQVILYYDPKNDPNPENSPFRGFGHIRTDLRDVFQDLNELQRKKYGN